MVLEDDPIFVRAEIDAKLRKSLSNGDSTDLPESVEIVDPTSDVQDQNTPVSPVSSNPMSIIPQLTARDQSPSAEAFAAAFEGAGDGADSLVNECKGVGRAATRSSASEEAVVAKLHFQKGLRLRESLSECNYDICSRYTYCSHTDFSM